MRPSALADASSASFAATRFWAAAQSPTSLETKSLVSNSSDGSRPNAERSVSRNSSLVDSKSAKVWIVTSPRWPKTCCTSVGICFSESKKRRSVSRAAYPAVFCSAVIVMSGMSK